MTTPSPIRTLFALLAAGAIGVLGAVAPRMAGAADLNACGCREGAPGQCVCEKKSHCGCPGECEPKGCEEKRAKQLEKEIQVETKKAEEAQRRQRVRQEQPDEGAPPPASGGKESRGRDGDRAREGNDRGRDGNDRAAEKTPPPAKKVRVVKMTPAQRRDLAKLIGAYLGEHPDQGGRAIDQVQSEMRK
jgi:hypothetical protein